MTDIQANIAKTNLGSTAFKKNLMKTQYSSIALVTLLAAFMIITSFYGLKVIETCKSKSSYGDTVTRNEKIIVLFTGIGVGLAMFMIFNFLINALYLLFLGMVILAICIPVVNSYEKLNNSQCIEQIKTIRKIMYGLIGIGIGLIIFSFITNALTANQNNPLKYRMLGMLISVFSIFISSVSINTGNTCNVKNETNLPSIIILVVNVVLLAGVLLSFKYM